MTSSLFGKLELDVEIKARPDQFHEVFSRRPHHLSNVSADNIKGVELHEGEWGKPGSVIFLNYFHDGEHKVAKDIIEAVDEENNSITFRVIEGDLMKEYKTFLVTIHVTPKGTGSNAHWALEYEKINEQVAHPESLVELIKDISKDLDSHLILYGKLESDVEIKASPEQFHDVFSRRPHHLSNICADNIKGVELHEGEWGKPGSVIFWNYFHDGEHKVAKEKIEAVDEENNSITFRVIEGDLLKEYKTFLATLSITSEDSGSKVHWILEYEKINEQVAHPESLAQMLIDMSKDIDLHLTLYGKLELDVEIKATPTQFHEVFSNRPHHLSNVSGNNVQSCDLHEGEWGKPGSVIFWNYFHDGQPRVAKEIIEAVDEVNNTITFRVIEGDLMKEYKNFLLTIQVTPKGTGSNAHWILEYEKISDEVAHPETLAEFVSKVSKDLDSHFTGAE
jgi:cell wall assembly regulator SMI1